MAKQKFELSSSMIHIPETDRYSEVKPVPAETENQKKTESTKEARENITFRMTPSLMMELRLWCVKNKMSISDALAKGFELLKESDKGDI